MPEYTNRLNNPDNRTQDETTRSHHDSVVNRLGYNGIYLERGGVGAAKLVEILTKAPEYPLNGEEVLEVRQFEAEKLYSMTVDIAETNGEVKTFADILALHNSIVPLTFFGKALLAKDVRDDLDTNGIDIPVFDNMQEVYSWLAKVTYDGTYSLQDLQGLSKATVDRYKGLMANALTEGATLSSEELSVEDMIHRPEDVITSAKLERRMRDKLLTLRKSYGNTPLHGVNGAKRAMIDIYLAKLNSAIAEDAMKLISVYDQMEVSRDDQMKQRVLEALGGMWVAGESSDVRHRLSTRLDYLINGMGLQSDGSASPISYQLEQAVRDNGESTDNHVFSDKQREVLRSTMVSPDRMQSVFERVIEAAGILRSEDNRDGFIVEIQPVKTSFSVTPSGIFMIPSAARSLYDALVVGGFYELTHIDQIMADRKLSEEWKIAKHKGKRVGVIREAGANARQRSAEQMLFGQSKPVSSGTYMKAIQALRSGGSLMDAARAFYGEKRRIMPGLNKQSAAVEAADRVLRLKRLRGYNSQPLAYAEEGIMIDELSGASAKATLRAILVTSFDLVDQVRMHQYGLLDVESSESDWAGLVLKEFMPDIEYALSGAGFPFKREANS